MKKSKTQYEQNHRLAKVVVCALYILIGIASIELNNPYPALVCGTTVWFFGVNPMAYLIEFLRKQPHRHNRV
ncbi:MAG: hypothetical protein AB8B48_04340 [Pseudomonadales bacterium]